MLVTFRLPKFISMELNYTAFFLISFIPLLVGWAWYGSRSPVVKVFRINANTKPSISVVKLVLLYVLSLGFVYGYMNMIIHQLGFYELFFTDIMLGKEGAQDIVSDFLARHGNKHRHFGHGLLHGVINAFLFALPIVVAFSIIENKHFKYLAYHFLYWLITSMIIGGLISEFI